MTTIKLNHIATAILAAGTLTLVSPLASAFDGADPLDSGWDRLSSETSMPAAHAYIGTSMKSPGPASADGADAFSRDWYVLASTTVAGSATAYVGTSMQSSPGLGFDTFRTGAEGSIPVEAYIH